MPVVCSADQDIITLTELTGIDEIIEVLSLRTPTLI